MYIYISMVMDFNLYAINGCTKRELHPEGDQSMDAWPFYLIIFNST